MDKEKLRQISEQTGSLMDKGYHCSEAVLWAGMQLFPEQIFPEMQRLATPFAGGIGGTNEGICGALAGAIMVIGAINGRQDGTSEDTECQDLAAEFYRIFKEEFGDTRCMNIKKNWRGKPGQENCNILVCKTCQLLFTRLDK
ncbi:MAG TPA: hypothetical protein DCK95_03895 [Anaerolineaceae bacterium]|nr:hypothetical protein [Anaerolineaceae bacterium]